MVLPLISIIAGAGLLGGGGIIGNWLGKGKKEGSVETHAPFEIYQPTITTTTIEPLAHYAPQLQFAPQTSYGYAGGDIIISSPQTETKKEVQMEQVSKPKQEGQWAFPVSTTAEPSYETGREVSGTNMVHIALIAGVALVGYGLLGKKKR